LRAALAEEVADLLSAWPPDYPESMREVCESLLAKALHDLEPSTRAKLRVQLYSQPGLAERILTQEATSRPLIEAARMGKDLVEILAESLGLDRRIALDILQDECGTKLAVACKASCMERCAFSALVLLIHPARDRSHAFGMLDMFDGLSAAEASRRLRSWQGEEQRLSA
jgi:hypothetical protein